VVIGFALALLPASKSNSALILEKGTTSRPLLSLATSPMAVKACAFLFPIS